MKILIYLTILLLTTINLEAKVLYSWSQLKEKKIIFRTIIDDKECPNIKINSQDFKMATRHTPTDNYPVTTCEVELESTTTATFNDMPIPTVQKPQKILVIGDTGCGGKVEKNPDLFRQDCADPNQWVFPKLIANAMKLKPDLVIHTGDLHYRREQCENKLSECYDDDNGKGYGSWKADFLDPMAKLLQTTPIILGRGNHDTCKESGEGWERFFSNAKFDTNCKAIELPNTIHLDNTNILVIDTSAASEKVADHDKIKLYRKYISDALLNLKKENNKLNILLSHKPIYSGMYGPAYKTDKSYNLTLFEAIKNVNMKDVDVTLHGHMHYFNYTKFYDPAIPPQLIVGNSGNIIYKYSIAHATTATAPDIELELNYNNHGFTIINLDNQEITLQYFDADGNEIGKNTILAKK